MKRRGLVVTAALTILLVFQGSVASADVVVFTPTEMSTRLAGVELKFDLAGIRTSRSGKTVCIAQLILPERLQRVEEPIDFRVYGMYEARDGIRPNGLERDEMEAGFWRIDQADFDRNAGGKIVIDVSQLVEDWIASRRPNVGLMISSSDESALSQLGVERAQLVVRYGFVPR